MKLECTGCNWNMADGPAGEAGKNCMWCKSGTIINSEGLRIFARPDPLPATYHWRHFDGRDGSLDLDNNEAFCDLMDAVKLAYEKGDVSWFNEIVYRKHPNKADEKTRDLTKGLAASFDAWNPQGTVAGFINALEAHRPMAVDQAGWWYALRKAGDARYGSPDGGYPPMAKQKTYATDAEEAFVMPGPGLTKKLVWRNCANSGSNEMQITSAVLDAWLAERLRPPKLSPEHTRDYVAESQRSLNFEMQRANRLSDDCGRLRSDNDELLRENAVLRRQLEATERRLAAATRKR